MIVAGAKAASRKKPRQKRSFLLTLGIILLVGYFVITIVGNFISINEGTEVLDLKNAEHKQLTEQNERSQAVIDSDDRSDYMEQVAREELGYAMADEKVFYDVTPGAQ